MTLDTQQRLTVFTRAKELIRGLFRPSTREVSSYKSVEGSGSDADNDQFPSISLPIRSKHSPTPSFSCAGRLPTHQITSRDQSIIEILPSRETTVLSDCSYITESALSHISPTSPTVSPCRSRSSTPLRLGQSPTLPEFSADSFNSRFFPSIVLIEPSRLSSQIFPGGIPFDVDDSSPISTSRQFLSLKPRPTQPFLGMTKPTGPHDEHYLRPCCMDYLNKEDIIDDAYRVASHVFERSVTPKEELTAQEAIAFDWFLRQYGRTLDECGPEEYVRARMHFAMANVLMDYVFYDANAESNFPVPVKPTPKDENEDLNSSDSSFRSAHAASAYGDTDDFNGCPTGPLTPLYMLRPNPQKDSPMNLSDSPVYQPNSPGHQPYSPAIDIPQSVSDAPMHVMSIQIIPPSEPGDSPKAIPIDKTLLAPPTTHPSIPTPPLSQQAPTPPPDSDENDDDSDMDCSSDTSSPVLISPVKSLRPSKTLHIHAPPSTPTSYPAPNVPLLTNQVGQPLEDIEEEPEDAEISDGLTSSSNTPLRVRAIRAQFVKKQAEASNQHPMVSGMKNLYLNHPLSRLKKLQTGHKRRLPTPYHLRHQQAKLSVPKIILRIPPRYTTSPKSLN